MDRKVFDRAVLFLRQHPEIVAICGSCDLNDGVLELFPFDTKENLRLVREAMGSCEKEFVNGLFRLRATLPSGLKVTAVFAQSLVCQSVKVGTKVVSARPAVPEHEEDVYEWQCSESILRDADTPS